MTATLTGITKGSGRCADCSRELTVQVFTVREADGTERDLGRRCAVKATGYAHPDREAARIARLAVTGARYTELVALGMTEQHARSASCEDSRWIGHTAADVAATY